MKISVLKIETLLAEKSMTKADLANRCGISRQNVSTLIRRGTCEPRTAGKLASGLGVEVREIIEKEGNIMIELPEGLVIISDEHCYIVGNPRKSRGKGVEIKNPKYYAHIDQAIQGALALILRLKVKNKEITTLRQFLDEQANLNQELRDMLTPQNGGGEAMETRGDEPATIAEGNYIPDKAEREKRHV